MTYQRSYPAYAQTLAQALSEDAFYITMAKAAGAEGLLDYLDYSLLEAHKYGRLDLLAEGVGAAIWSLPLADEKAQLAKAEKLTFLEQLGGQALATYRQIVAQMSVHTDPLVTDSDWYLSILGLVPSCQGQGLGGKLLKPVLQRADEQGARCFIETFVPRNESFYQRLGFEVAGRFTVPAADCDYALMIRPAQ